MVRYLFYTIGDLTYHSPLVLTPTNQERITANNSSQLLRNKANNRVLRLHN